MSWFENNLLHYSSVITTKLMENIGPRQASGVQSFSIFHARLRHFGSYTFSIRLVAEISGTRHAKARTASLNTVITLYQMLRSMIRPPCDMTAAVQPAYPRAF
jgi:hypothetical protein